MNISSQFTGFPVDGIDFLRELTQNNNKLWFEANKQRYIDSVQTPAVALVVTLGQRLQAHFPDIHYDPRTNGSGSLMRFHRDTRFSADKSPYKTNIAMMFASAGHKKTDAPGFGLQITPEQVDLVAGIFAFSKEGLDAYRKAVLDEQRGAELLKIMGAIHALGGYSVGGQQYKRVPAGFDTNHPRADWLKFTGLHVFPTAIPLEIAQTPALVDVAMEHFVKIAPIREWLIKVLG